MTFGSCAMRDSTLDSCGNPEMRDADAHMRHVVVLIGDRGHSADADFLIRQSGADVAHQAAAVESLHFDIDRKFAVAALPQSTASTRAGAFALRRARLAQA